MFILCRQVFPVKVEKFCPVKPYPLCSMVNYGWDLFYHLYIANNSYPSAIQHFCRQFSIMMEYLPIIRILLFFLLIVLYDLFRWIYYYKAACAVYNKGIACIYLLCDALQSHYCRYF